jgi:putative transposase
MLRLSLETPHFDPFGNSIASGRVGDLAAFLSEDFDEALTFSALRKAESISRPVGSPEWLAGMETRTGRTLAAGKRGPNPRDKGT